MERPFILFFFLLAFGHIRAQDAGMLRDMDSIGTYFRQGNSCLDPYCRDNGAHIRAFTEQQRAEWFGRYINGHFPANEIPVLPSSPGIDREGVILLTEADPTVTAVHTYSPAMRRTDTVNPAVPAPRARKPFYMALKTNLLYDALVVPNIGLEFYLGRDWSVAGNWMYTWLKNNNRYRHRRIYGGEFEVRRWFGAKKGNSPLTGHHVGLYGQMLSYDLEWDDKGYLADRWSYGGGIAYGYSAPIGRRLNLDFTLGIGYLGGEYKEYVPREELYVWRSTKKWRWFGPTKAEISLVWLQGRGNLNEKNGKQKVKSKR